MKKIKTLLLLLLTNIFMQVCFAQDITEVEATGVGVSEKAAIKDASRNAVLNVAGVLMESSTDIKNDEVIEDKIIAVSAGFIESLEILEPVKEISKGYYAVKIKAKVKHKQLAQEINISKVSEKSFNMRAIRAAAEELISAQEEMGNFIRKSVDDYMNLWKYEVVDCNLIAGKPSVVVLDLVASLTKNDYMTYHNSLLSKFKKIGITKPKGKCYISMPGFGLGHSYFNVDAFAGREGFLQFRDYVIEPGRKYVYVVRIELKNSNDEVIFTKDIRTFETYDSYASSSSVRIGESEAGDSKQTASIRIDLYSSEAVNSIAKISTKLVKVETSEAPDVNKDRVSWRSGGLFHEF